MTEAPVSMPRRTTAEVDWQRVGAGMDTTLPATNPVTEAILGRLPDLPEGSTILDLACGTGQPSFVLAHARPGIEVLGVDVTPAMIDQARIKALSNSVARVRFEVMSVDRLALPDSGIDAAVSQFGLLQEGDVAESVRELARVLAPGAPFSIAAFDDMVLNTFISTVARVLAAQVPAETMPDFDYLTRLAKPGLRERLLREAGAQDLHSELFQWSIPFPSFEVAWRVASGPVPFAGPFDALDDAGKSRVRSELEEAVAPYRTAEGAVVFPMACRLFWGRMAR